MQVTGTFPELSAGRTKGKKTRKLESSAPYGQIAVSRRPRRVNAPKTLAGRRSLSHQIHRHEV